MPSAGPIFYERIGLGERFAALPIQPWVQVTADYLWGNYQSRGAQVGVGISAFPSLHVAGAAWIALTVSLYARRLSIVAWSYFAIILVGSVSLGWHYAVDGIAGVILALGAWKLTAWPAEKRKLPILTGLYKQS
jgi:membrane-associated phospholipid phosphatase